MLRAMYSGVSGLRGFQTKLDVIGNNIANVNTIGFKKGRIIFQDVLSQNIAGATAPDAANNRGGVNPRQVGLGVQIGAIDTIHTPGSPMSTGVLTDLSIAGDGFFLIVPPGEDPTQNGLVPWLTRAGNFTLDAEGNLVTADGYYVLGQVYEYQLNNGDIEPVTDTPNRGKITIDRVRFQDTNINNEEYKFVSYEIARNGDVIGYLEDGRSVKIATLEIGFVTNPGGLKKLGGSYYEITNNAQQNYNNLDWIQTIDEAQTTTEIISGQLEMSNVDLAEEFTEMIIAQRGFQANTRIITTSDEILQELVNMKR